MPHASLSQIRKSCLVNFKAAGALQGSHASGKGMLLFYSAECGLKALVMAAGGHRDTSMVAGTYGHNLRALVAAAGLSPSELKQASKAVIFPNISMKSGKALGLGDFHVAMRYGIDLSAGSYDDMSKFLDVLTAALRKRLF